MGSVWKGAEEKMLILLVMFSCTISSLLGCIPGFKYVPSSADTGPAVPCRECDRGEGSSQSRFFINTDCCSQTQNSNKVGLRLRLKNATDCGRRGGKASLGKIVGGTTVLENELPWQVALISSLDTWWGCGAVLLSCDPLIVVTAAHCVQLMLLIPTLSNPIPLPAHILKVAFGAHALSLSLDKLGDQEVRMDVEEVIIHPSFTRHTVHAGINLRNLLNVTLFENDIAVIKVKNASDLQCRKDSVWPACPPNKDTEYAGWTRTILSGWGRLDGNESLDVSQPRVLRKTSVPIVSDKECSENWNSTIVEKQLCSGHLGEVKGSAQGDSGGPLVAEDEDHGGWSVVGIVSWGSTSHQHELFGVYTEIGQYLDWIGEQFGLLPPL